MESIVQVKAELQTGRACCRRGTGPCI